jgi:hypothetical protein
MDIVERLRSGEDGLEYVAAAEIETLRAAIKTAIENIDADDAISAHNILVAALGEKE